MNWIGLYTLVKREIERMLRVAVQTLITPWISAVLYIFIFGYVIGTRIEHIQGEPYIQFVLPGILMMSVITAAFSQSSSSLYFQRFAKHIEEILVAPFSHLEMIIGYVAGSVVRAVLVGVGVLLVGILFDATTITNFPLFLFYIISVSIVFSLVGLIVGLWANGFEQLNILNTFFIMPFTFLGGVFYSVHMLPANIQFIVRWNPFFYFIDGIRNSMIGIQESNALIGYGVIAVLIVGLGTLVVTLFSRGWRIRQ